MSRVHPVVSERDPLLLVKPKLFSVALEVAAEFPKGAVAMVLVDLNGNEIGSAFQPKGKLFVKTARAKVLSLSKTKDYSTLLSVPPVQIHVIFKLIGVLTGLSKSLPVEGVLMIEYEHPETGDRGTGYFCVSGRNNSAEDVSICKSALLKAAFTETATENVFAPPKARS
jgi:hypothetical protein